MKNKNIFDEDDDDNIEPVTKTEKKVVGNIKPQTKVSVLDEDDEDIFAPTIKSPEKVLVSNVVVQPKNILVETKAIKEEIIKKINVVKNDKPVFKYNSDDEIPW